MKYMNFSVWVLLALLCVFSCKRDLSPDIYDLHLVTEEKGSSNYNDSILPKGIALYYSGDTIFIKQYIDNDKYYPIGLYVAFTGEGQDISYSQIQNTQSNNTNDYEWYVVFPLKYKMTKENVYAIILGFEEYSKDFNNSKSIFANLYCDKTKPENENGIRIYNNQKMSSLFLDYINAIDFEDVVEPYESSLPRGYSITNYSKAKFYTPNDYKLSMSNLEDNAHFVSLEAPTDNEYYLRIDIKWYDNEGDIEKTARSLETPIVPNAIFKGSYSTKLLDRPTMTVDHIVYKKGKEELYIKSWIFNQDNHLVICHVYTDYELGPQMIEVSNVISSLRFM